MKIHVVIPAYKVESQILALLPRIGKTVSKIWVVDDACPNGSGQLVAEKSKDERVRVLFHEENKGVGGAVITETVFAVPGAGRLMIDSIYSRDYPVVQGLTIALAILVSVTFLLTDILQAWLDPRVTK